LEYNDITLVNQLKTFKEKNKDTKREIKLISKNNDNNNVVNNNNNKNNNNNNVIYNDDDDL